MRLRNIQLKAFVISAPLLCFCAFGAYGLDVGAMFHIGNLGFPQNWTASDTNFTGAYYPWGISAYGSEQVSDTITINSGFYNDPILRNIAYSTITYQGDYFSIGAGPLLGLFNSSSQPLNPGITASVQIQVPGIAFLSYRVDSSLGGSLSQTGAYQQSRSDISLGYYIPNAIASANLDSKQYQQKTTASGYTTDQVMEYSFKVDIFQKNVPYRVVLTFGYQTLSKIFEPGAGGTQQTWDRLGSVVVGTRLELHLTGYLMFIADLNSGVYTFGQKDLLGTVTDPGLNGYLFQLQTGMQISLGRLLAR